MERSAPGTAANALLEALADRREHCLGQLTAHLAMNRRQVSRAAGILAGRRLIERSAGGCYRLNDAGQLALDSGVRITSGPPGPTNALLRYNGTFRARAWKAMHVRRCFTIGEVLSDAQRDNERDMRRNLQKFVSLLSQAGYVTALPRRAPGVAATSPGHKRYLLKRYTGPLVPIWRESRRTFFDQNTGEEVACRTPR